MSNTISDSLATKIERSENKITAVLNACDVGAPGQSWIDWVFDPFKDDKGRAPCVGRPDGDQRNITVSTLVEQVMISRPASVPAGSTWDCHVVNLQQNNVVPVTEWEFLDNNTLRDYNPSRPAYNYGGVQVMAGPAGSALGMPQTVANIGVPYAYYGGQNNARVIGKAHQIINTTSQLNVQGNLMYYEKTLESPEDTMQTFTLVDAGSAVRYGVLEFYNDGHSFQNPSTLLQVPKTRQHEAKFGVYQVAGECDDQNISGTDRAVGIAILDVSSPAGAYINPPAWVLSPPTALASPSINTIYYPFRSPFNIIGSYLTGLSSETTLMVTATWIIETAPPVGDVRMMSLAFPAPARDNCALQIYSRINHDKPAGCKLKDNAIGDWIQTIGDLAAMAGVPGAGLLSTGGKLVNKVQEFYNDYGKDWVSGTKGNNPSQKAIKSADDKKYDKLFPGTYSAPTRRMPQKKAKAPRRVVAANPPRKRKNVQKSQKRK